MNCWILQFLLVKSIEKLGENVQHTILRRAGVVVDSLLVVVMRLGVNVTSFLWYFALKSSLCGFKSLSQDSCTSLDSCPFGIIAVEIILDL
jgi:hypothetical protein